MSDRVAESQICSSWWCNHASTEHPTGGGSRPRLVLGPDLGGLGGLGIRRPLGRQLPKEEAVNKAFQVACAVWSLSSPNQPYGKSELVGATKAQTHPKSLHVLVCKMGICRLRTREITIRLALSKHLLFTRHSFKSFLCTHPFYLPSSSMMEVVLVSSTNEETEAQKDIIMYLTVRMQQS